MGRCWPEGHLSRGGIGQLDRIENSVASQQVGHPRNAAKATTIKVRPTADALEESKRRILG